MGSNDVGHVRRGSARIAVDIGGTFTDLVLLIEGRVARNVKLLTTSEDPSVAVETGIAELLAHVDAAQVREIVHGTTLVSNLLIERKGAVTALLTTRGFRDVMTIRREHRFDLYDLFLEMPEPLVPRRLTFELSERVLADGSVDRALDPSEVRRLCRRLAREGIQSVAICLLHAYRNPDHERAVAEILRQEAPGLMVSLSSEVSPELGEFARMSTVSANAYVMPLVSRYLETLEKRLAGLGLGGPLRIMLSTGGGGLAGTATARRYPVRLLESGPAAGALAAGHWGGRAGRANVLAFDMGGTTAKACLVEDGVPMVAREFEAARMYRFARGSGLPLRVPVVDLIEIGAGGGSIATVGPFGLPKVGPESTGAVPGPASYGQGGEEATVTDADLLLGYLNPEFFLGGDMRLDEDAARRSVERLGVGLGLGLEAAAAAVHRVVNENMAIAARMHAVERGRDLRRFALVATGGAGPVHAWGVARALGITELIVPPSAGVASAFGMLTAAAGFEYARSLAAPLGEAPWPTVRTLIDELVREGRRHLKEGGVGSDGGDVRVEVAADVRHRGQGESVTVELGSALTRDPEGQIEAAFEDAYVRRYGRRPPGVEAEVMTWRVRVRGPAPELSVPPSPPSGGSARKGWRDVWFAEAGRIRTEVWDRYRLGLGQPITGPAVIEERESTTVIGPGGSGVVEGSGALVVQLP